MKTAEDPRHLKRIERMQELFAYSFHDTEPHEQIADVLSNLQAIDDRIARLAPEWPIEKIAKIDLAILRLSIWELSVEKKNPVKVVIDEAVELAKEFGNEHSAKFVNGVLGSVVKEL